MDEQLYLRLSGLISQPEQGMINANMNRACGHRVLPAYDPKRLTPGGTASGPGGRPPGETGPAGP
jgi:hypothetical protein